MESRELLDAEFLELARAFADEDYWEVGARCGNLFEGLTEYLYCHAPDSRTLSEPWTLSLAHRRLDGDTLSKMQSEFPEVLDQHGRRDFRRVLQRVAELRNRSAHHGRRPPTAVEATWLLKEASHWLPLFGFQPQLSARLAARSVSATHLVSVIERHLDSWDADRPFLIEVIGFTLHKAWPLLRLMADKIVHQRSDVRVRLDATMLEPDWVGLSSINPHWPMTARQTANAIVAECAAGLLPVESVRVRTFESVPQLHGFRLNQKVALVSLSSPFTDELDQGREGYLQVHVNGGDAAARALWRQFDLVWRSCEKHAKRILVE